MLACKSHATTPGPIDTGADQTGANSSIRCRVRPNRLRGKSPLLSRGGGRAGGDLTVPLWGPYNAAYKSPGPELVSGDVCRVFQRGVERALRSLCARGGLWPAEERRWLHARGTVMEDQSSMSITYKPKKIPRRRKHGFLSRMATSKGRLVLKSRRNKGRWKLSVSDERRAVARGHR